MMTEKLKAATRELHEQIEADNLAKHIVDHSIDMETYRLLILQNYLAYKNTESAIAEVLPNFEITKYHQLEKDLENLGIQKVDPQMEFTCHTRAEALGAAYVVEGSALGGMVLAKHLPKCAALADIKTHHFFNGNRKNLENWNRFKQILLDYDLSEAEQTEATEKARETFRFFGKVFETDFLREQE